MGRWDLCRCALTSCVALALLTGCGGNASTRVVPVSAAPDFLRGQKTFHYIDAAQHFRVPARVRQINVDARGAKGAGSQLVFGGRVRAIIPVTPGERLVVYVGGDASGLKGGFNGGGDGALGGVGEYSGSGGGGATDVREAGATLADRIVVAGGGGGNGGLNSYYGCNSTGGKGGGLIGGSGFGFAL